MQADSKHNKSGYAAILAGGAVTLFAFTLYVLTLAPTVLYYDRPLLLDSAMLQVEAIVLGIAGGTGSPSWVMLTHLFTYLPVGDLAYRTNLASATYTAGAVALVYVAGYLLSRRIAAAAAGAIAFGLGTTLWSVAVMAEVYGLNALLIMCPVVSLLVWRRTGRDRYLLFTAFLMGFAMTNHLTSGLVVPGAVLFVAAANWRKILEWRLVLKCAGLFVLSLTPYLYLPIRSSMHPPLDEWSPTNLERFWYLVGGGDHQNLLWAFGFSELPGRFMLYGHYLFQNFHWGLVMVGMVGMALLIFRDRPAALLVGFLFSGWLIHAVEYSIFDVHLYFITTYLMVSLAIAVGFGGLLGTLEELVARFPWLARAATVSLASVALVAYPILGVEETYASNDMSEDYKGRELIETVAEKAQPNSTVLHHRSSLWYMVLVEKRRQDLTLIDPWPPGRQRYTDIVWPDDINYVTTNLRYGTNDSTGVSTAREAAEEGAVYIVDQESAGAHNFHGAGFSIVRVERGILYELVPPGGKVYTSPGEQRS